MFILRVSLAVGSGVFCVYIMAKTYSEKLRDPRWQKKRLEIMDRDGFKCRDCGSKTETLNVHHAFYRKGAQPWEYENESLITVCQPCHQVAEDRKNEILQACVRPYAAGLVSDVSAILNETQGERHYLAWVIEEVSRMSKILKHLANLECEDSEALDEIRNSMTQANEAMHRFLFSIESKVLEGRRNQRKPLDQLIDEAPDAPLDDEGNQLASPEELANFYENLKKTLNHDQ